MQFRAYAPFASFGPGGKPTWQAHAAAHGFSRLSDPMQDCGINDHAPFSISTSPGIDLLHNQIHRARLQAVIEQTASLAHTFTC